MKKTILWIITVVFVISMIFTGIGCKQEETTTEETAEEVEEVAEETTEEETEVAEEEKEPVTISVGTWLYAHYPDFWDAVIESFEAKYPYITVELRASSAETYVQTLTGEVQAGTAPDVIGIYAIMWDYLKDSEVLMDLTPALTENNNEWADSFVGGIDAHTRWKVDDGYYGIVIDSWGIVTLYNKDIFTELNLEVPKTIDEAIEVSAVLKENDYIPVALSGTAGESTSWCWALISGLVNIAFNDGLLEDLRGPNGAYSASKDYKFSEDPIVIKWAEELFKLAQADIFNEGIVASDNQAAQSLFYAGKAAMLWDGSWHIANLLAAAPEIPVGIALPISFYDNEPIKAQGAMTSFGVNNVSEHPEEALLFAKYFSSAEAGNLSIEKGGPVLLTAKGVDTSIADEYNRAYLELDAPTFAADLYGDACVASTLSSLAVAGLLDGKFASVDEFLAELDEAQEQYYLGE